MRIADIETARRIVRKYGVSEQPTAVRDQYQTWSVWLRACRFTTVNGKAIQTDLHADCGLDTVAGTAAERKGMMRAETAWGKERLARHLLALFDGKHGLPGYRGWFTMTELTAIYDPHRRAVVRLDRKQVLSTVQPTPGGPR